MAIARPGPLDWADEFVGRRHGRRRIRYAHAALEPILHDTYGIIAYHEQVMRIAATLGGISPERVERFRRNVCR